MPRVILKRRRDEDAVDSNQVGAFPKSQGVRQPPSRGQEMAKEIAEATIVKEYWHEKQSFVAGPVG